MPTSKSGQFFRLEFKRRVFNSNPMYVQIWSLVWRGDLFQIGTEGHVLTKKSITSKKQGQNVQMDGIQ